MFIRTLGLTVGFLTIAATASAQLLTIPAKTTHVCGPQCP
jgi:hypothetical protein